MLKGFKNELKHEDLYATPEESLAKVLHQRFNKLVFVLYIGIRGHLAVTLGPKSATKYNSRVYIEMVG